MTVVVGVGVGVLVDVTEGVTEGVGFKITSGSTDIPGNTMVESEALSIETALVDIGLKTQSSDILSLPD